MDDLVFEKMGSVNFVDFERKLENMAAAARKAGDTVRAHGEFRVERKAANDFVTEMDLLSEKMIREELLGKYPEDSFYGEEGGIQGNTRGRFVVDPIDGTTNFIHGIVPYTVSIAYQLDDVIELGVVYCPMTNELFTARRGHGAFCNGKQLHVSDGILKDGIVGTSFAHRQPENNARMLRLFPKLCPAVSDLRRLGSAAYDLCMVAAGRYEAFMELALNLYDFAAGALMVTEAGGIVTGWAPEEDFMMKGNIIAARSDIAETLMKMVME